MRPHPLHLVLGFVLWSIWFVAMYAGLSVACALQPPAPASGSGTAINLGLLLLTLVTAALLSWLAWKCWRAGQVDQRLQRFLSQVAAGLYLAATLSTLVGGLPVALLPPCV
ncbi:MAG TPA: hypothetical protein GX696_06760 [Pseudomonadaceae bacterium]|nr:hypothetical protein [Pseudomonadaceae bacterium]